MSSKEEIIRGAMYTLGALTTLTAVGVVMKFMTSKTTATETSLPKTAGAFGVSGAFPYVGATAIEHQNRFNGMGQQPMRMPQRQANWGSW